MGKIEDAVNILNDKLDTYILVGMDEKKKTMTIRVIGEEKQIAKCLTILFTEIPEALVALGKGLFAIVKAAMMEEEIRCKQKSPLMSKN